MQARPCDWARRPGRPGTQTNQQAGKQTSQRPNKRTRPQIKWRPTRRSKPNSCNMLQSHHLPAAIFRFSIRRMCLGPARPRTAHADQGDGNAANLTTSCIKLHVVRGIRLTSCGIGFAYILVTRVRHSAPTALPTSARQTLRTPYQHFTPDSNHAAAAPTPPAFASPLRHKQHAARYKTLRAVIGM